MPETVTALRVISAVHEAGAASSQNSSPTTRYQTVWEPAAAASGIAADQGPS